jgi:ABC-type amino acid transport substrate-binding protein
MGTTVRQGLTLLLSIVAICVAAFAVFGSQKPAETGTAVANSRLDQVVKSGNLRVGYLVFPPYISKNAQTGEITGVFATLTEDLAKNLGVKVVWVEEVSLSSLAVSFQADRIDMIATPLWRSGDRAKTVDFSTPLFYSVVGTYVRAGDTRFDTDLGKLNANGIRVAALDGEMAGEIAKSDFPLATVQSLPQLTDYSQMLLEIASKKSDVTFYNRLFANRYMSANPGKIRELTPDRPIRVFAECFVLPIGDPKFASLINNGLLELLDNGGLERALRLNGEKPEEYFLRAPPYRNPS